jgi:hypothetical protein
MEVEEAVLLVAVGRRVEGNIAVSLGDSRRSLKKLKRHIHEVASALLINPQLMYNSSAKHMIQMTSLESSY